MAQLQVAGKLNDDLIWAPAEETWCLLISRRGIWFVHLDGEKRQMNLAESASR